MDYADAGVLYLYKEDGVSTEGFYIMDDTEIEGPFSTEDEAETQIAEKGWKL